MDIKLIQSSEAPNWAKENNPDNLWDKYGLSLVKTPSMNSTTEWNIMMLRGAIQHNMVARILQEVGERIDHIDPKGMYYAWLNAAEQRYGFKLIDYEEEIKRVRKKT